MSEQLHLKGLKFGKLTVVDKATSTIHGKVRWLCRCDCGKEAIVVGAQLKGGRTKSCGCISSENTTKRNQKHRHSIRGSVSRTYKSWQSMRVRVMNENNPLYRYYGGRGVKIDKRWDDFEAFLEDMGDRPLGKSLDRINVNGHYEKSNCRWADKITQANNKRNNVLFEWQGQYLTPRRLSEISGIPAATIYGRLHTLKWPIERAMSEPVHPSSHTRQVLKARM